MQTDQPCAQTLPHHHTRSVAAKPYHTTTRTRNMRQDDQAQHPTAPPLKCPDCGRPAEITQRFTLDGAPTAVEHVRVVCVAGHWFTPPTDALARYEHPSVHEPRVATALRR
jgi:hypothetical protein